MDYVGLLSGGKDSVFNLLECSHHGHRLVCLANVSPPETAEEEQHSYMYQTAGSRVLDTLSKALQVPLLRQYLSGGAVDHTMHYGGQKDEHDEVEDLFLLLQRVKEEFPTVKGVAVGAIVSNYQRHRVESCCQRLGLIPLAYLWQCDRMEYVKRLCELPLQAILVKVAGAGLEPTKHLGRELSHLEAELHRLHEKYGTDVAGEGGEYESLVLDAPFFSVKMAIPSVGKGEEMGTNVLEELVVNDQKDVSSEVVVDTEDSTVGNLVIHRLRVERKSEFEPILTRTIHGECIGKHVSGEDMPSVKLSSELTNLVSKGFTFFTPSKSLPKLSNVDSDWNTKDLRECIVDIARVSIQDSGFGQTSMVLPKDLSTNVMGQVDQILSEVTLLLADHGVKLSDVVFVHLYVSSMNDFQAVNGAYCKYFGVFPPSRSCVASLLPRDVLVAADFTFLRESHQNVRRREVLHVQSQSAWAPLCIGPYAQANTLVSSTAPLTFVAGQIPLDPGSMEVLSPTLDGTSEWMSQLSGINEEVRSELIGVPEELILCLRHASRVLNVQRARLFDAAAATIYVNGSRFSPAALEVLLPLLTYLLREAQHRDWFNTLPSADEEAAMMAGQHSRSLFSAADFMDSDDEAADGEELEPRCMKLEATCPVVVTVVPDLPRSVRVEVEIFGPGRCFAEEASSQTMEKSSGTVDGLTVIMAWRIFQDQLAALLWSVQGSIASESMESLANSLVEFVHRKINSSTWSTHAVCSVRLYIVPQMIGEQTTALIAAFSAALPDIVIVPVLVMSLDAGVSLQAQVLAYSAEFL